MIIRVYKARRRLEAINDMGQGLFSAGVALGRAPEGPKQAEGDGRTPEGRYRLCLIKEKGKYGRSLGLSYPGPEDADAALKEGRIDPPTHQAILQAHSKGARPPWGTPLGGEIYLHGGGTASDWTQGCIALEDGDIEVLFGLRAQIEAVEILP